MAHGVEVEDVALGIQDPDLGCRTQVQQKH